MRIDLDRAISWVTDVSRPSLPQLYTIRQRQPVQELKILFLVIRATCFRIFWRGTIAACFVNQLFDRKLANLSLQI